MKNLYLILSATFLITSCGPTTVIQSGGYENAQPAPAEELSYQSFYDQLSPYGNWINYPGYGYVWMPNAGPDFRPYATNGNWIYTDAGWTWASNYNWGWAPFHYGRWFFENGYGWMWVPGNEWAPAWVSWRGGNDYYGWAPLGPRISIDIALNSYNPPMNYWNFVPRQYMGNPNWHQHYVNEGRNITIISNTTIINNYSGSNHERYAYAPGPDPNEVRRVSGNNFTPVQIREANNPGERMAGSQYVIYHPRVSSVPAARGDAAGRPATPAPARYESFDNTRPVSQNPSNNLQPVNHPNNSAQNPANNHPPVNNQPVGNSQPAYVPPASRQNPAYNQPVNNQPYPNNQPAVNPHPATQNPGGNQPVNNNIPANNHLQQTRANQFNHPPGQTSPPPVGNLPQPSPANRVQTTGRPSDVHNPNNGHPVQQNPKPVNHSDQRPSEKPKNGDGGNNQ